MIKHTYISAVRDKRKAVSQLGALVVDFTPQSGSDPRDLGFLFNKMATKWVCMRVLTFCMRVLAFYPVSYHFLSHPVHSLIIRGRTTAHSEATGPNRRSLTLPQEYKKGQTKQKRSKPSICVQKYKRLVPSHGSYRCFMISLCWRKLMKKYELLFLAIRRNLFLPFKITGNYRSPFSDLTIKAQKRAPKSHNNTHIKLI